ncbi:hypothetical protein [Paenibacillus ferrarius]|uniref:hypothetical protein n=1 Tax=Paenibacillus ferrarius TaxID=1469647 RepID=UPI003D28BCAD
MAVTLADWMLYTLWGIFGLMMIDFLIAFFQSFWKGAFDLTFVLDYLKDVLYYILPLDIIVSFVPADPTKWTLVVFFFIAGIAVIFKFVRDIIKKFN